MLELKGTRCTCCSTPLGSRTHYVTYITYRLSRSEALGENSAKPRPTGVPVVRSSGHTRTAWRIVARRCEPCWFMQMLSTERCAPVTGTYRIDICVERSLRSPRSRSLPPLGRRPRVRGRRSTVSNLDLGHPIRGREGGRGDPVRDYFLQTIKFHY